MGFFKNFIVAMVLTFLVTRALNFLFLKRFRASQVAYISFFIGVLIFFPVISLTVGFDIAVYEYIAALVVWLIFDLIKKKK